MNDKQPYGVTNSKIGECQMKTYLEKHTKKLKYNIILIRNVLNSIEKSGYIIDDDITELEDLVTKLKTIFP